MPSETMTSFPSDGIKRLAAFETGQEFDAAYLREVNPVWEHLSDEDCHRAWLSDDSDGPSCGRDHLHLLGLQLTSYPQAFPWRFHAMRRPSVGANRWTALDDFVARGFAEDDAIPYGDGAGCFLVALGRSYAGRLDRLAIKALELASSYGDLAADERQHLGDAYLREGLWASAVDAYGRLIREREAVAWTVRNFVSAATKLNDWDGAVRALRATRAQMERDALWRLTADETIGGLFAWRLNVARALYAENQMTGGDKAVAGCVVETFDTMQRLSPAARRPAQRECANVVIFRRGGDGAIGRRLQSRIRLFEAMERQVALLTIDEICPGWVPTDVGLIVFFEIPASMAALTLLKSARAAGVPTIYDVGGCRLDPGGTRFEDFHGYMMPSLYGELKIEIALQRGLASLCDFGLASCKSAVDRLTGLVRRGAWMLRDCMDPPGEERVPTPSPRTIFVRSSHFLFIDETHAIGSAILDTIQSDEHVSVVSSGFIKWGQAFDGFADRIVELDEAQSFDGHTAALSQSTLNLAVGPDSGDAGNVGETWLWSACCGVPSILRADDASDLGLSDRDCLIVDQSGSWREAIDRLLADPTLARSIGAAARRRAREDYDVGSVAADLNAFLARAVDVTA